VPEGALTASRRTSSPRCCSSPSTPRRNAAPSHPLREATIGKIDPAEREAPEAFDDAIAQAYGRNTEPLTP
jgi:hypothetical protein